MPVEECFNGIFWVLFIIKVSFTKSIIDIIARCHGFCSHLQSSTWKKVNHCPLHLIKVDQKLNDQVTKTFSKHQFWFLATLDEMKWAYGFRNR